MAHNKGILANIEERSDSFAIVFLVLFGVTFASLSLVGMTPDRPGSNPNAGSTSPAAQTQSQESATTQATTTPIIVQTGQPQIPVRIEVKRIGLDAIVSNPSTTDVNVLDQYLLKGAVRYPTSAPLGVPGTVLLFGHSSYLPIVRNQNYKTFDGIQDLKSGDIISVYSVDTEYRYSVTSVNIANANSDVVQLPQQGQHLTLVTCDSFATKSNRFIVTADLISATPIGGVSDAAPAATAAPVASAAPPTPVSTDPMPQGTELPRATQTSAVIRALFTPTYPPHAYWPHVPPQQARAIVTLLAAAVAFAWL